MRPASLSFLVATLVAGTPAFAQAQHDDEEETVDKTEIGAVPLFGGSSDIGIGGGALASVTRLQTGYKPYVWGLQLGAIATFRSVDGRVRAPFQDYYLDWIVPHLIRNRLRLEVRPAYTDESTLGYFGVGNASTAPESGPEGQSENESFHYGRVHPTLLVRLRVTLGSGFYFLTGNTLTYNWFDIHPGSRLDIDQRGQNPGALAFIERPVTSHAVDYFEEAIEYDTRDDETTTSRGMWHQVKIRLSPGGSDLFPYRYGQANVTARFYVTPVRRYLTVSLRAVGDVLFGDAPFYELARYEDTYALGGVNGVRGVPAQRYSGKVKAFGNIEARSEVLSAEVGGKEYTLAIAAFFDAGRVWADWRRHEELDGTGAGLKYGVGGGLRLQQGHTFVVRGDVAWSPDARPIGAYFTAGQTF
jgi:hypothetical protein